MQRARKQCKTCPFRGMPEDERREHAIVDAVAWPCHTEHPIGWGETQCRGHWEAQRKYPPTEAERARFAAWQEEFNAAFAAGVAADKLPEFHR